MNYLPGTASLIEEIDSELFCQLYFSARYVFIVILTFIAHYIIDLSMQRKLGDT